jgi:hypothetical protein
VFDSDRIVGRLEHTVTKNKKRRIERRRIERRKQRENEKKGEREKGRRREYRGLDYSFVPNETKTKQDIQTCGLFCGHIWS